MHGRSFSKVSTIQLLFYYKSESAHSFYNFKLSVEIVSDIKHIQFLNRQKTGRSDVDRPA